MRFLEFWNSLPKGGKARFAKEVGIDLSRLSAVAHERIRCGAVAAMRIAAACRGIVSKQEIAPHVRWPKE